MTGEHRADEALTMSAQHLQTATIDTDGRLTAFVLTDGEEAVEINHEIGSPEAAATRLAAAGRAMIAHAEAIRRAARSSSAWT